MRDSMKITVPYQIWCVILTHMEAAGISFVFQTVAFWAFIGRNGFKEILGVIFTLIYAGFIYHIVRKLAILDYKDYTPMKPSVAKGILLGASVSAVTALMFTVWKLTWIYSSNSGSIVGWPATIFNFIFNVWTFPFFGLMGTSHGHITVIGHILMYGVPIAAAAAGYLAAKHNIDIADIIQRSVYEKPDKE